LASNGVWVKPESKWGRAPHPLVIASNTEDDGVFYIIYYPLTTIHFCCSLWLFLWSLGERCGRGLLAREGMAEGELLMTIPLDIW
jgi:hypothetical protein